MYVALIFARSRIIKLDFTFTSLAEQKNETPVKRRRKMDNTEILQVNCIIKISKNLRSAGTEHSVFIVLPTV